MGIWYRVQQHHVPHSSDEKLWEACGRGEATISLAERYIDEDGADIEFTDQDFGVTPLMMACGSGCIGAANLLIQRGANINAVSVPGLKRKWGNLTALHFACSGEASPEMIEWLLECGANPAMVDDEGKTAINLAREQNMPKSVIDMLEQSGSVISRDMDYYVPARSTWKNVHVEIFVMMEAGRTDGTYRHEMVWHDNTTHLASASGIISLADYSVNLLDEEPEKKSVMMRNKNTTRWFNIEFRPLLPGGADLHHPTFSIESSEKEAVALGSSIHALSGSFFAPPPAPTHRATIAETPCRVRFNLPTPAAREYRHSAPSIETSRHCQYCVGHRCHCEAPATASFQGFNPMRNKQQEARWNSSPRPMATRSSGNFRSRVAYFERCGASSAAATAPKPHSTSGFRLSAEQHSKLNAERRSYTDDGHNPDVRNSVLTEFAPSPVTKRGSWHR